MSSLPTEGNAAFADFERAWSRSEKLYGSLSSFPKEKVLKSGMIAQRKKLLRRWDNLEVPGLNDDAPGHQVMEPLKKWIRDAEVMVRYIGRSVTPSKAVIQHQELMGAIEGVKQSVKALEASPDSRESSSPFTNIDLPEPAITLSETEGVTDAWCWPWEEREEKAKSDKTLKKLLTYGAIGAGALYFAAKWMEE